jgi:hypothetical protein
LLSIEDPDAPRNLMEAIVRAAAGVLGAAASSIRLIDVTRHGLVRQSAWGAGAREIVAVPLPPGTGIVGGVVASARRGTRGLPQRQPFCGRNCRRSGPRPHTMLVVELLRAHARSAHCPYSIAAMDATDTQTTWTERRCSPSGREGT